MYLKHEEIKQKLVGKQIQDIELNIIRNVLYDITLVLDDEMQIVFIPQFNHNSQDETISIWKNKEKE